MSRLGFSYVLAVAVRLYLMKTDALVDRVEVSSPITSYKRLTEGVRLAAMDGGRGDPYDGELFHETPITLRAFEFLQANCADYINVLFVLVDLAAAMVLGALGRCLGQLALKEQDRRRRQRHEDAKDLELTERDVHRMEERAQLAYLFNPYLVASCAAKTTTVASNFFLAAFLLAMTARRRSLACLFLALSAYQSFYPVMLIVPLCLAFANDAEERKRARAVVVTVALFVACLLLLLAASYHLMDGRLTFLSATYGFILSVPELTPNVGLFWYFFTEMFEHFRVFFVCTFQLNIFIYVAPLAIKLRRDPFLLAFTLTGLIAVFKSYPAYGDVGFYLALLPLLAHLFPFTKQVRR